METVCGRGRAAATRRWSLQASGIRTPAFSNRRRFRWIAALGFDKVMPRITIETGGGTAACPTAIVPLQTG